MVPSSNDSPTNVTSDVVFAGAGVAIERRDTDILFIRGGLCMHNPGNKTYRNLVKLNKVAYCTCPDNHKKNISESIVAALREENRRFLAQDKEKNWYDIGDKIAIEKVSQALREGQSELRENLRSGEITTSDVISSGVSFDEAEYQARLDGSQRGVPEFYAMPPPSSPPYKPYTEVESDIFDSPVGVHPHRDIPFVSPEAIESMKSINSSEGLPVDSIPQLPSVAMAIANAEATQFSDISRFESNKSEAIRGSEGDCISVDSFLQDIDSMSFSSDLRKLVGQQVPEISRISDQNNTKEMNCRNRIIQLHEKQRDQPNGATTHGLSQINFASDNQSQMSCVTINSNSSILPKNMSSNEQKIKSTTIRTNTDMRSIFAKIHMEDTMKSNESMKACKARDRLSVDSKPQRRSVATEIANVDASRLSQFSDITSFDSLKQVLDGMSFGSVSQSLGSFSRSSDEPNSKLTELE